jgi:hypothetical protein
MTATAFIDNDFGKITIYLMPAVKAVAVNTGTNGSSSHDNLLRIYFPEGQRSFIPHGEAVSRSPEGRPKGYLDSIAESM